MIYKANNSAPPTHSHTHAHASAHPPTPHHTHTQGATVIDFAYHVHTDVGNQMAYAKVNNQPVHASHVLQNAEVVEVITYDGPVTVSTVGDLGGSFVVCMHGRCLGVQLLCVCMAVYMGACALCVHGRVYSMST